jgi:peptidoglycan/xylan/chitin deacetylase (PgdA/CDA1 family)
MLMKRVAYITTSWDDGHPLDFRVAELLARYGLQGTFYVPRSSEFGTMTAAQLRELSGTFEIGGHTLRHVVLTRAAPEQARQEITDCKAWLEESTGRPCSMFCPPRGKHTGRHLAMIRQAGYLGVRGTELLSLDAPRPLAPRRAAGLLMLPTTVQAHPHGLLAYARNLGRRAAFRNLYLFLAHGRTTDWTRLARSLLAHALESGGVFHLWGHSWEIEQSGQWRQLEETLRLLGQFTSRAAVVSNGELCRAAGQAGTLTAEPRQAVRLPFVTGGPSL